MTNRGLLLVVSGPSGAGKGTVCAEVVSRHPEIFLSVSATTRQPREGETNGKNYFFLSESDFKAKIEKTALLNGPVSVETIMELRKTRSKRCWRKEKT